MFRDVWDCAKAIWRLWIPLLTGSVFMLVLDVLQNTGHKIPFTAYWIVALGTLFVAFFKAWRDEHRAKEAALKEVSLHLNSVPRLNVDWGALLDEKHRLESELEAALASREPVEPQPYPGMLPDEPGYWPVTWAGDKDYGRISRKIDSLREELELVKQRLAAGTKMPLDKS